MSQQSPLDLTTRQKLVDAAYEAATKSYSPYSKFRVGSALLSEAGNVFIGTNIENISYGLSHCAERVAIGNAVMSEGPRLRVKAIAVISGAQMPISPCGACRQVIQEFGHEARVIYPSYTGLTESSLTDLLPGAFDEIISTQDDGSVTDIQVNK